MKKSKRLSEWHFRRLFNKEDPRKIIQMHIVEEINLTSKQLDEVLKKKNQRNLNERKRKRNKILDISKKSINKGNKERNKRLA